MKKKAYLSVDQAYAQAKALMRGRILSQDDYLAILNRMLIYDIYPFTMKLVNVGIRVAESNPKISMDLIAKVWWERRRFKHPETGHLVLFKSLPLEMQRDLNQKVEQKQSPPGEEIPKGETLNQWKEIDKQHLDFSNSETVVKYKDVMEESAIAEDILMHEKPFDIEDFADKLKDESEKEFGESENVDWMGLAERIWDDSNYEPPDYGSQEPDISDYR
jgi:hypothetical protein